MKDGDRERPIENYGMKEQKEWLDNTLPDLHPFTAGNKEEEHTEHMPTLQCPFDFCNLCLQTILQCMVRCHKFPNDLKIQRN